MARKPSISARYGDQGRSEIRLQRGIYCRGHEILPPHSGSPGEHHSGEPGEADPKRAALALLGLPDGLEAEWLENEEGPCMCEVPPRGPEHRLPEPEEGGIPEGDSKEVTRRKERAA